MQDGPRTLYMVEAVRCVCGWDEMAVNERGGREGGGEGRGREEVRGEGGRR